jgi:uncharacterized OB-fold protein
MSKKCKECGEQASTERGYCFMCAEELAYLLAEAAVEFGYDPVSAAQAAWK